MIALKLPIGLGVLVLIGLCLFLLRRLPREWELGMAIVLTTILAFLCVLAAGVTSGGIRHALPAVVLLSVFAGCGAYLGWTSKHRVFQATHRRGAVCRGGIGFAGVAPVGIFQ